MHRINNFAVRSGCEILALNMKCGFIIVVLYGDALSTAPIT